MDPKQGKPMMQVDKVRERQMGFVIEPESSKQIPELENEFRAWLKPRCRHTVSRGREWGSGGGRGGHHILSSVGFVGEDA